MKLKNIHKHISASSCPIKVYDNRYTDDCLVVVVVAVVAAAVVVVVVGSFLTFFSHVHKTPHDGSTVSRQSFELAKTRLPKNSTIPASFKCKKSI